ncbi:hypothetical protein Ancab_010512 [Ancistrocladus abbreviatus]
MELGDAPKTSNKCTEASHLSCDFPDNPDVSVQSDTSNGWLVNHPAGSDNATEKEDDIHEIGEEEKGKLNDVDYLTGNPLPNDILLYAIPVCVDLTVNCKHINTV